MNSAEILELIRRVSGVLADAGLAVDGKPDCSGELATCGTTQKPHGTAGRYAVHLNWPPNVWLVNYHEGGEGRTVPLWDKGEMDRLTEAERETMRERIRREKEEAERKAKERRQAAAEKANLLFWPLPHAGEKNAYLARKGVAPRGDMRQDEDGRLVLPVRSRAAESLSSRRNRHCRNRTRAGAGGRMAGESTGNVNGVDLNLLGLK